MYLFVGISIITFLMTFSQSFIRFLSLGSRFIKETEDVDTLKKLELAKQELKQLELNFTHFKNDSDEADLSKAILRMRVENKIRMLRSKLEENQKMVRLKGATVDRICGYAIKGIFVIMLAYISLKYRYTPVVIFDNRFDFAPFGGIITFPTGVPNAISVPFWIFSSNLFFNWFGNMVSN